MPWARKQRKKKMNKHKRKNNKIPVRLDGAQGFFY